MFTQSPIENGTINIVCGKSYIVHSKKKEIIYFTDGTNKHPRIFVKNPQHVIALSISDTEYRIIYHANGALYVWNPKIINNKPTFLCKIASKDISCIIPLDGTEKIVVATTATATTIASRKEYIINVSNETSISLPGTNIPVTSYFHYKNLNQLIATNESGTMIVRNMNTSTNNIPTIIQNSPMANIRLFASDMLVYNGEEFLVSIHENNDIVLWNSNKYYDQRWKYGNRSDLWIVDNPRKFKTRKAFITESGDKVGLTLSVCVVGKYIVTGHEGNIIIRYIKNGSERMQKLKLPNNNMAAVKLIPVPGTSDFYSILCPVGSEQKDKTLFGFVLHETKGPPLCFLWKGPKYKTNKESKGLNGTV